MRISHIYAGMMNTLLVVNSSGRVTRSITRRLSARFVDTTRRRYPALRVIERDVGLHPLPTVNEAWIAAAFADPARRTPAMRDALALSEELIGEVEAADAIVLGVPMYNFGVPASLKAYFDQIIRVGRTFSFDPDAPDPYQPLLKPKPVFAFVSAGDGSLLPGGEAASMNFLDGHLRIMCGFVGLNEPVFIHAGYDEYQDDRQKRSVLAAEAAIDELVAKMT